MFGLGYIGFRIIYVPFSAEKILCEQIIEVCYNVGGNQGKDTFPPFFLTLFIFSNFHSVTCLLSFIFSFLFAWPFTYKPSTGIEPGNPEYNMAIQGINAITQQYHLIQYSITTKQSMRQRRGSTAFPTMINQFANPCI